MTTGTTRPGGDGLFAGDHEGATVRARLGQHQHLLRTADLDREPGTDPDRPGPGDERGAARPHATARHGVPAHRHRFDERPHPQVHAVRHTLADLHDGAGEFVAEDLRQRGTGEGVRLVQAEGQRLRKEVGGRGEHRRRGRWAGRTAPSVGEGLPGTATGGLPPGADRVVPVRAAVVHDPVAPQVRGNLFVDLDKERSGAGGDDLMTGRTLLRTGDTALRDLRHMP